MKRLVRQLVPAPLRRWLNDLLGFGIRFSGPYSSWAEASRRSAGYDQDSILTRVRETSLRVRRGEFAYEQDSVGFVQQSPPLHLLSALAESSAGSSRALNVLDFGGALGSLFQRARPFIEPSQIGHWLVCEQDHFVKQGLAEFAHPPLCFSANPSDALRTGPVDLLVLSSVLPYLQDPLHTLSELSALQPRYILIDRTPFSPDDTDHVLVQHTPRSIYRASYPLWLLSLRSLDDVLKDGYTSESNSLCAEGPVVRGALVGEYRAMLWRRKPSTMPLTQRP